MTPPQDMTAVDDLKSYQKYAQAHVDGLKNLIASFATLYDALPDDQKKSPTTCSGLPNVNVLLRR